MACFALLLGSNLPAAPPPADEHKAAVEVIRLADNPILRPEMMPKNDGPWSGNLNFPSLIRVPDWVSKPLGKYYLYFSAHHGSYVRLAYAERVEGPWKVYEPGTLRLEQVEAVNGAEKVAQRHIASPDVHVDNEHRQIRMYFHYLLPKLGHSSSVAFSTDGLKFEPRPGTIGGPYLRVFHRNDDYLAIDDKGVILRSRDGTEPFRPLSHAVARVAGEGNKKVSFRHAGVLLEGEILCVFFTRIGDTPEQILLTRLRLTGDAAAWQASTPVPIMQPEREWEGVGYELVPSSFTGQTDVRQLRDPFPFTEDGRTYLFYAVAGESGIAVARLNLP